MGIVQSPAVLPGQVGVIGAIKYMVTTDSLATITAAGYLNQIDLAVNPIFSSDVLGITYLYNLNTNKGTFAFFTVSISNGVITLAPTVSTGDVLLPVVSGDIAVFNGTTGQIKDSAVAFSNLTDTVSPLFHGTATAGDFVTVNNANKTIQDSGAAPSAASQPFVVMSPGGLTTNHIAQIADANGTIKDGGVLGTAAAKAASNNAQSTLASTAGSGFTIGHLVTAGDTLGSLTDSGIVAANVVQSQSSVANNFVSFSVLKTLTFTQLATAGKVNIVTHPTGTAQFVVTDIKVLTSTGLSGGGGDRLLSVADGTLVFNNAGITAALLGTPIFTIWGGTGNPIAVSSSQVSTAGADIFFQYIGGTTDYTAGSVQVIVTLVQVTA